MTKKENQNIKKAKQAKKKYFREIERWCQCINSAAGALKWATLTLLKANFQMLTLNLFLYTEIGDVVKHFLK